MMTEWGTIGYWEMETTSWGTPTELTSSEKADVFLRAHNDVLATFEGQLIGSYVFFWGQKQERTPTWFGLLTERGELTEAADAMHRIWTGEWPANRMPRVEAIHLDGKSYKESVVLTAGGTYDAVFDVVDPEGDPLTYRWEVKPESKSQKAGGDREERLPNLEGILSDSTAARTTITAPSPASTDSSLMPMTAMAMRHTQISRSSWRVTNPLRPTGNPPKTWSRERRSLSPIRDSGRASTRTAATAP